MFINDTQKDWGKGIPPYEDTDLMTDAELYDFALDVVAGYESEHGAKLIDASPQRQSYPSIICQIDGELSFILVEASVAPKNPVLSENRKNILLNHARKFNAKCYYAPVCFGACDADRFNKSLALKGDAFYVNYEGLEEIN